jgi:hypothetical protein
MKQIMGRGKKRMTQEFEVSKSYLRIDPLDLARLIQAPSDNKTTSFQDDIIRMKISC